MMEKNVLREIRGESNGVVYLGETGRFEDFEERYLEVRVKEGRLLEDDLVRELPWLPEGHHLKKEWLLRADTLDRFSGYLKKKNGILSLLELGCGNGWFINRIHDLLPGAKIYGLDINKTELEQAARIFSTAYKTFLFGDVFEDVFEPRYFDLIILNSTIQYFPDPATLVERLLELLNENGEIHILDSPFYKNDAERNAALNRSDLYFSKIGSDGMMIHYHHHSFDFLRSYHSTMLYNPYSLKSRLLRRLGYYLSPFPWIRIKR